MQPLTAIDMTPNYLPTRSPYAYCSFFWLYGIVIDFSLCTGATKSIYAPDPFDVGRILQAEIMFDGRMIIVPTAGPIDPGT